MFIAQYCKKQFYTSKKSSNIITVLPPGNEASRAMCHVEGSRRVREPLRSKDPDKGRDPSFERELNLGFMSVPGREGHGKDVSRQKVCSPTRNLR